jgi:hypothetical protein
MRSETLFELISNMSLGSVRSPNRTSSWAYSCELGASRKRQRGVRLGISQRTREYVGLLGIIAMVLAWIILLGWSS